MKISVYVALLCIGLILYSAGTMINVVPNELQLPFVRDYAPIIIVLSLIAGVFVARKI